MAEPVNPAGVNQTDYLNLFMQELTYQDPLKPVDNREFMAQMAQFSALQEAHTTNEKLTGLLKMTSASQGLNLLGKLVKIDNGDNEGRVSKVEFYEDAPPQITVILNSKEPSQVAINQITSVRD